MTALERAYRRLLALYPDWFRREHEDEMVAVLLAGSDEHQRRPGPGEAVNLIWNAVCMRLSPQRSQGAGDVRPSIWLMYLGAALELAALGTIERSLGSMRAAISAADPRFTLAQWHAVLASQITPAMVATVVAAGLWLTFAWLHGHGWRWSKVAFGVFFGILTYGLLADLGQGVAAIAPAAVAVSGAVWLTAFATVTLFLRSAARAESAWHKGLPLRVIR